MTSCIETLLKTENIHLYNKCLFGIGKSGPTLGYDSEMCNIKELIQVAQFSFDNNSICPLGTPKLVCRNNHWYCE